VRLERADAAELLLRVVAAFPDRVRTASISHPGLADVFFRRAGRVFEAEDG
jgi:hypothetical protein